MREVMKRLKIKDLAVDALAENLSLAKNNLIPVVEFEELYAGISSCCKWPGFMRPMKRREIPQTAPGLR